MDWEGYRGQEEYKPGFQHSLPYTSVPLTQSANIFEGVVSSAFSELFEKEMFYQ